MYVLKLFIIGNIMRIIIKIEELHANVVNILNNHLIDNSRNIFDIHCNLVSSQNVSMYQLKKALMTTMFIELESHIYDCINGYYNESIDSFELKTMYEEFKDKYDRLIKLFTEEFEYSL